MKFLAVLLVFFEWASFAAEPLARTTNANSTMKAYNLALQAPAGWVHLYPRHDRCLFLVDSQEGGIRRGAFTIDASVGLRQEQDSEETLLKRIAEDFPQAKKLGIEGVQALGALRRVHLYDYEIPGTNTVSCKVAVCLALNKSNFFEVLLFGKAGAFDQAKPAYLEMLRTGKFLDENWTLNAGQKAYLEGVKAAAGGRYAAGLLQFREAVASNPDDAKMRVRLAMAYEQSGALEKALAEYTEVQRLDPSCPDGWYGAGQIAARQKRPEQALSLFLRGTTNCPMDYTLHAKAAEHLGYAKRYAEALAEAKRSFEINSDQGPAMEHLIKFLELLIKK